MALARATRAASSRACARSDASCRLAAPPAPAVDDDDDEGGDAVGPLPMVPVPLAAAMAAALLAAVSAESITTLPSLGPPYHSSSHFSAILHTWTREPSERTIHMIMMKMYLFNMAKMKLASDLIWPVLLFYSHGQKLKSKRSRTLIKFKELASGKHY